MKLSTQAATDFLRSKLPSDFQTQAGIILGSGLGGLANKIEDPIAVDYESIPGFVRSTAGGHQGRLIFGTLESVNVVAMAGRFHRYEGWTNDQATFPVHVMNDLGAESLIVSNAAGGVSPKLSVGDIVILRDHLNWMGGTFAMNGPHANLVQPHRLPVTVLGGSRRGELYDRIMADTAGRCAMEAGFNANFGTYLATLGPNYETRSEYRMMRKLGVDVVGMSTVPEVLVAGALGMRVLGLSMVSNVADPDRPNVADHQEVLVAGQQAGVKMEAIVRGVLSNTHAGSVG